MQFRRLGRSEFTVSSIGLGCVTLGREIDRAESFAVLDRAFERGITLFDTAEAYSAGGSERVLGEWMAERRVRERIVLATKVAVPLTSRRLAESADASLQRLQTDHIDLFQLHSWDATTPLEETLDALTALVATGKVRHVGCSNWSAWQLARAHFDSRQRGTAGMLSLQPAYNLVQREIEPDLIPLCAEQQIAILSYSPLGAGFLTGKYRQGGDIPRGTRFDIVPGHEEPYFTRTGFRIVEGLRQLAAETGQSMAQLALGWVLRRPGITAVLIGARSPQQIDQAFAAESADMSDELRARLDAL